MKIKPQIWLQWNLHIQTLLAKWRVQDVFSRDIWATVAEILNEALLIKNALYKHLNSGISNFKKKWILSTFDWWIIEVKKVSEDIINDKPEEKYWTNDIIVWERRIEEIIIWWKKDYVYFYPVSVAWVSFSLIWIPSWLKSKKLSATFIWKQLLSLSNDDLFPYYKLDEIVLWDVIPHFIVVWSSIIKWETDWLISTPLLADSKWKNSLLKMIASKWFTTNPILESIFLCEIIMNKFWIDYVNFEWRKCDSDEIWYLEYREKVKQITQFLWINEPEYSVDQVWPYNWREIAYKNLSIYKNWRWRHIWALVWNLSEWLLWWFPNSWAVWWLFTLDLWYWVNIWDEIFWIRPSLWMF